MTLTTSVILGLALALALLAIVGLAIEALQALYGQSMIAPYWGRLLFEIPLQAIDLSSQPRRRWVGWFKNEKQEITRRIGDIEYVRYYPDGMEILALIRVSIATFQQNRGRKPQYIMAHSRDVLYVRSAFGGEGYTVYESIDVAPGEIWLGEVYDSR